MKKLFKYSVTGALLGGIGYLMYKNSDLEKELREISDNLKARRDKWVMNNKTNDLLINTFISLIIEKPDITLDEAILRFENAKGNTTLEEFAETKMRIADSYRKSYKPYFEKAKKILCPER